MNNSGILPDRSGNRIGMESAIVLRRTNAIVDEDHLSG